MTSRHEDVVIVTSRHFSWQRAPTKIETRQVNGDKHYYAVTNTQHLGKTTSRSTLENKAHHPFWLWKSCRLSFASEVWTVKKNPIDQKQRTWTLKTSIQISIWIQLSNHTFLGIMFDFSEICTCLLFREVRSYYVTTVWPLRYDVSGGSLFFYYTSWRHNHDGAGVGQTDCSHDRDERRDVSWWGGHENQSWITDSWGWVLLNSRVILG